MTGGWQQPRVVVMCFCIFSLFSLFADILRSTHMQTVGGWRDGPDAVATYSFSFKLLSLSMFACYCFSN
jgi:hypothetical protein